MARTLDDLSRRWLGREAESLSEAEKNALASAAKRRPVSRHREGGGDRLGDRLADRIARVGGSWSFIVAAILFLVAWTLGNVWLLGRDSFDPYPFIFLNLVLSMLAALQAPVIMMAQNRQSARDRDTALHDYEVNLKAEIEIMALHEKLDELRQQEIRLLREEVAALAAELRRRADGPQAPDR